jgi:hypothetical protein
MQRQTHTYYCTIPRFLPLYKLYYGNGASVVFAYMARGSKGPAICGTRIRQKADSICQCIRTISVRLEGEQTEARRTVDHFQWLVYVIAQRLDRPISDCGRIQATLTQPRSPIRIQLPAPARHSILVATTHHDRTTRRAVVMSSEASVSYSGVAAHDSSRLHAGHVYNNVINSERSLISCTMRNNKIVIQYLRLFKRLRCWWRYSESQIAAFTAKSAGARRQSCPPRALQGCK